MKSGKTYWMAVGILAASLVAVPAQPRAAQTPAVKAPTGEIALPVHGQQELPLSGTPVRVAVGDPAVADIRILPPAVNRGGVVLLVGKAPGTTRVQVWLRGSRDPQVWTVHVNSAVHSVLSERGLAPEAKVDAAGGKSVVSSQSASMLSHRRAVEAAAAAAGGEKGVVDLSTVGPGGVVQVEVKVVELSKNVLKQVGLDFNASGSGPWSGAGRLFPTDVVSNGFQLLYDSANFSARLGLLQTNGMARILAEPTLVALSGQSASFLAGGEIPVPESGGLGTQNVTYKPFGIGLTVTPTVLSRERIALKVAPEASELDPANGIPIINGENVTIIPALRTRKADTTVELGDGESFVISGLVSRQTIANVSKLPFLGDLPIIGAFFRSVRYSQEDRELVIVVTPRLVRPIARGTSLPLPGGPQEESDRMANAWGYYLLGPAGGQQMPGFSR